jgi:hypothetical protein
MPRTALEAKVISAWKEAATRLGVRVFAPFSPPSNPSIVCVAHLPDFGSPNGMVVGGTVPPEYLPDEALSRWAKDAGLYLSVLNLEPYRRFDSAFFQETLEDWGFFGPPSIRPIWLPEK